MIKPIKRKRILILNDDIAGGHTSAGKAVQEVLQQNAYYHASYINFVDHSSKERYEKLVENFDRHFITDKDLGRERFFILSKRPPPLRVKITARVERWVKRLFNFIIPSKNQDAPKWMHTELICITTLQPFYEIVRAEKSSIIVSMHPTTNGYTKFWRSQGQLKAPTHTIVTDYVASHCWACDSIKRYYVANEQVKQDLIYHGVNPNRIIITGIPVSPVLTKPENQTQREMKKTLGLSPDLPVVLILGGSRGDLEYETLLHQLNDLGGNAQFVVFCGSNVDIKNKLELLITLLQINVTAKGFQSNMSEWYQAADLIITKPGGITTTEIMIKQKPMILMSPYAGMEELQAERLSKQGVALYGRSPKETAELYKLVLADSAMQQRLKNAMCEFCIPDGAKRIAEDLQMAV